jgi:CheY-like chemotaxis protein
LEAPTGEEALIVAWSREPDLVLFDARLTDIPDKEFMQRLRNDARTEKVRLVAFSGDPSLARRQTCPSAGVDKYIVKSSRAIPALETETSAEAANEPAKKAAC